MITFKEQLELFKIIGEVLKERAECVAIGGSAMMFHGTKDKTKDVDLVFLKEKDRNEVKKALYSSGFDEKIFKSIFAHYKIAKEKPIMMEGKDTRFDLFLKEIISFKMTDSILERIKEIHEFGKLIVKVIIPEDVILLKCATDREKDRIDAFNILKKFNINWEIIIQESINQTRNGKKIFPVFLYDFLLELKEDLKADVPDRVIKEIRKISEKEMINTLGKQKARR